jgi:hypothetical protein
LDRTSSVTSGVYAGGGGGVMRYWKVHLQLGAGGTGGGGAGKILQEQLMEQQEQLTQVVEVVRMDRSPGQQVEQAVQVSLS